MKLILKDERQIELAYGAVVSARAVVFDKWKLAPEGDEKDFYRQRTNEYDALMVHFDAARISDKSQDAEPEEDDDEDN